MLFGKRGQGAMEFVMTYGWALIVILVALSSLTFYLGFDTKAFAAKACFLGPGLSCDDFAVYEDSISMSVRNSLGKDVETFSIGSASCGISSDSMRLDNGAEGLFTLSDCNFNPDDLIEEPLTINYSFLNGGIEHMKDAVITAVVEIGSNQNFGGSQGGNGYHSDGNTVVLYKFDEGDGSTIGDSSSNKLDGTFNTQGELIDNGDAEEGSMFNFNNFDGAIYDPAKCYDGDYCFTKAGQPYDVWSEEFIAVDLAKTYTLSGHFVSTGSEGRSKFFFGYVPFDENQIRIRSEEINPVTTAVTETTLYADVQSTDTTVRIVDGTNWLNDGSSVYAAFDIDDSGAYADLPNRDLTTKITDILDYSGQGYWELVLEGTANVDFIAGTKVRQHKGAGSYMYEAYDQGPPDHALYTWKEYDGTTTGENLYGTAYGAWWRGTKFAKIVMLLNFQQTGDYAMGIDALSMISNPVTYLNKWVTGKYGSALEFNGNDDQVVINYDGSGITDQLTVEAWIYPKKLTGTQRAVFKNGEWAISVVDDNVVFFIDTSNGGGSWKSTSAQLPSANTWYHVAGVYDGTEMRIYVDGVLNGPIIGDSPKGQTGDVDTGGAYLIMGSNVQNNEHFKGYIDEVRVSDYARYT